MWPLHAESANSKCWMVVAVFSFPILSALVICMWIGLFLSDSCSRAVHVVQAPATQVSLGSFTGLMTFKGLGFRALGFNLGLRGLEFGATSKMFERITGP